MGMKFITTGFLFCAILFSLSCLNPIGFTPDLNVHVDGTIEVTPGDPNQNDKPGDTSPTDDPDLHPDPDKGSIIFKNLTGGQKAMAATFAITGQEHTSINAAIPLNPGQEKSIALLPGHYDISISFDGAGSPISGSKALLAGRVEYVYFYVGKDGSYKGGINVDSDYVYGDINLSFYQDNENGGDNNDNDNVNNPEEGDVSRDNEPRGKLPGAMRENYGIAVIHNLSKSMPLLKAVFDHYANDDEANGVFDTHWEMNPGPDRGNRKSIILRPGLWKIRAIWVDPGDPACAGGMVTTTIIKAGIGNYVNHLYFYKGTDGKYQLTTESDNTKWVPPFDAGDYLNNSGNSSTGGAGENEGDSPGSLTNINRDSLGLVVVKNLAKDADIEDVRFKQGLKEFPASSMSIQRSNQRSILLGTGDWAYYLEYYSDSRGSGRIPPYPNTNTITVVPGNLYTLYFYQDSTGGYSVTDNWPPLAPALPPLTDGNVDPVGDNEGYLHIRNASSSTILTKLSYQYSGTDTEMNFPGNVQLVPGAESANDAILPVGTTSVRFFNGIKQRWSGAIPVNIRARQVFTVTYTDGMDIADLPDGYGMVRVSNRSSEAVQSAVFYDTQMTEHSEIFTLPSGDTDSIRVPIGSYVVQFRMESFTAEFVITLDNGINRIVAVTITDSTVTGKPDVTSEQDKGGIRVFNAYPMTAGSTAYLDMKIFKFFLYRKTQNNTYESTAAYTFNGVSPYNPISRGQGENISNIEPDYYKLKVVAGSYPWTSYTNSITIDSITLNETLITYDCGEILIVKNQERQYYFNNYSNEKDTPNGYVTFNISCSDDDNTYAIVHFEIAVRPNSTLTVTQIASIYSNNPWPSGSPDSAVRTYDTWPGHWNGSAQGPYAPKDTLVFEWGGLLNSYTNQTGPFAIPPGIYWTRYNDNYTNGSAYGSGTSSSWRLIDLRGYAKQHVNCACDHTVGTNWAPVPQR
jgi:hypothetical protein